MGCQSCMWHKNSFCTISYYRHVFIHLFQCPAWNPCLIYQPWSKCLANTMESPTHPCNTSQAFHRFQVWHTKFKSPQFSFSLLISYPLSEAFRLQSLGMILTAAPQCTFTFAVFWQATGKERWISLLLCVRDHTGRKPNTTFSSLKLTPLLCQNPTFQVSRVHFPNVCMLPLLCHLSLQSWWLSLNDLTFPPLFHLEKRNLWLQLSHLLLHISKTALSVWDVCQAQSYLLWLTQPVPSLSHLPALCSHILPIPEWSAGKCHAAAPQPLLMSPGGKFLV